jgi:hypothetical protein
MRTFLPYLVLLLVVWALWAAEAQSPPAFIPPGGIVPRPLQNGDVPTAAQWNSFFEAKQNYPSTELSGRITLVNGTAVLNGIFPANCFTADVTNPSNVSFVVEGPAALTFSGTGSDVIKYICG